MFCNHCRGNMEREERIKETAQANLNESFDIFYICEDCGYEWCITDEDEEAI